MTDLNALPLPELYAELAKTGLVTRLLELARDEDLGERWETGDPTSQSLVPTYARGSADIVYRVPGVAAGLACLEETLHLLRVDADVTLHVRDGQAVVPGVPAATINGRMQGVLSAERLMLNIVGRLSGVATRAAKFVAAAAAGAQPGRGLVYDTRKTTPGMRVLEKYAVRCGGAMCHRIGLFDAVLIKDNHLAAVAAMPGKREFAEDLAAAIRRAREESPPGALRFLMVEVDTLDQFRKLLDAKLAAPGRGADIVLLDNMTPADLAQAVAMRDAGAAGAGAGLQLEASGGVTLESIGAIAATGVDRISTGSMTHGATWLDVGLDVAAAPTV